MSISFTWRPNTRTVLGSLKCFELRNVNHNILVVGVIIRSLQPTSSHMTMHVHLEDFSDCCADSLGSWDATAVCSSFSRVRPFCTAFAAILLSTTGMFSLTDFCRVGVVQSALTPATSRVRPHACAETRHLTEERGEKHFTQIW